MRYRIKTETLANGNVYHTAQVLPSPPWKWLRWICQEDWHSISPYNIIWPEDWAPTECRQTSEEAAEQCIATYRARLSKEQGERVIKTEYRYL